VTYKEIDTELFLHIHYITILKKKNMLYHIHFLVLTAVESRGDPYMHETVVKERNSDERRSLHALNRVQSCSNRSDRNWWKEKGNLHCRENEHVGMVKKADMPTSVGLLDVWSIWSVGGWTKYMRDGVWMVNVFTTVKISFTFAPPIASLGPGLSRYIRNKYIRPTMNWEHRCLTGLK
jgi:hypothetical protein